MAFSDLVEACLEELHRLDPVWASIAGVHEHDSEWPDWSARGVAERLAWADAWTERLTALEAATLSRDEAIDRDRLLLHLDAMRFDEAELREATWNPMWWSDSIGSGLFPLLTREFAPLATRLASATGRLEGLPRVFEAARDALDSAAGVPVSRLHAETAITDLEGIDELIDLATELGAGLGAGLPDDPAGEQLRTRLSAAADLGRREAAAFRDHLRRVVVPAAEGEGRLGPDRFRSKYLRTFADPAMTPEHVLAVAQEEFATVRAEMLRIARRLWPAWCPGVPLPEAEGEIIRGVIEAIGRDHPAAEDLLDACRLALERTEAFCRETGLLGLLDDPLVIDWTPLFLRSAGGAMLLPPGPLDRGQTTFFYVTPPDDAWSPERRESFLREENHRNLQTLSIHEGVPGHHLQAAYRNRVPSVIRSGLLDGDGVYAEGWAVYIEQVLFDRGFAGDDEALVLVHWKTYLRAVTNAILDIRVHRDGIAEEEALRLMIDGAFQEESEARSKYVRARLTSGQLSTYFVGSLAMWEIEDVARRRAAKATADPRGAAAVPVPSIVTGYPSTPGFEYRPHLESILAAGELPMPLLRRVLLEG